MIGVSAKWAAGLAANHTPLYRVEVWRTSSQLITSLSVTTGTVTKDAGQYPRVTAAVQSADLSPSTAQLLTVFGSRLRIFRGLRYPDNTSELPLIADVDILAARLSRPDSILELECADASAIVAADQLGSPRPLPGWSVRDAIGNLLSTAYFFGSKALTDATGGAAAATLTAKDYAADGDRWDAIEQLADSAGAECFFTPSRAPLLRPAPSLAASPAAALYALDGGTVTALQSELTRAPNTVFLYGGPDPVTGKQLRGVAWDNSPTSPTWTGSPYGRVVLVESRPAPFPGQSQANQAAAALLRRVQSKIRTVTLECVPNPAIEPGDTVEIRFTNGALEKHLVRRVEIPLGVSDPMRVTTETTAYTTQGWP